MQIKINMKFYLTPGRTMKSSSNKGWRCGGKDTLLQSWWEFGMVQTLWKTVYELPKNLRLKFPLDQVISPFGISPKELKASYHSAIYNAMSIMPINVLMDKEIACV